MESIWMVSGHNRGARRSSSKPGEAITSGWLDAQICIELLQAGELNLEHMKQPAYYRHSMMVTETSQGLNTTPQPVLAPYETTDYSLLVRPGIRLRATCLVRIIGTDREGPPPRPRHLQATASKRLSMTPYHFRVKAFSHCGMVLIDAPEEVPKSWDDMKTMLLSMFSTTSTAATIAKLKRVEFKGDLDAMAEEFADILAWAIGSVG
ncbi:hypothetical protein Efla_000533 [Eimeria flavescens]